METLWKQMCFWQTKLHKQTEICQNRGTRTFYSPIFHLPSLSRVCQNREVFYACLLQFNVVYLFEIIIPCLKPDLQNIFQPVWKCFPPISPFPSLPLGRSRCDPFLPESFCEGISLDKRIMGAQRRARQRPRQPGFLGRYPSAARYTTLASTSFQSIASRSRLRILFYFSLTMFI